MATLKLIYTDDNGSESTQEVELERAIERTDHFTTIFCAGVHELSDAWTKLCRKISERG